MRAKGGRVFVHCYAGVSRSPTVCIAYLMKLHQWSLSQAYDYVKSRRPHISPNLHFMGQLLAFQKQLESDRSASDASCVVPTCLNDSFPQSHFRTQIRCSSAPSVYVTEDSRALDSNHPQTRMTCKAAACKGLINLSLPKFPLTP